MKGREEGEREVRQSGYRQGVKAQIRGNLEGVQGDGG